jgi:hypothetical protein
LNLAPHVAFGEATGVRRGVGDFFGVAALRAMLVERNIVATAIAKKDTLLVEENILAHRCVS